MSLSVRGFRVRYRDGRSVGFRWWCLLPAVALPLAIASAILFQPNLRQHLKRAARDPGYLPTAVAMTAEFNQVAVENLLFARRVREHSDIPDVRVQVRPSTLEQMLYHIRFGDPALGRAPIGDRPEFRAYYDSGDGRIARARISIRGTSQWHHRPEKPSLRLKVKREDIRDGVRYLDLQRPEDALILNNTLPDRIGREMGLISDQGHAVRVFINRKFMGVYRATLRAGEPLALRNGRMPGTFFKGDQIEGPDLWASVDHWQLYGDATDHDRQVFSRVLAALRAPPTHDSVVELGQWLDLDSLAKWSALMITTGSVHTDRVHNHMYFLTTYQGKVEAVPWDSNSFGIHGHVLAPVDLTIHPMVERVLRDPRWVHRRNGIMLDLLEGPLTEVAFQKRVESQVARYRKDLESDIQLSSIEVIEAGIRTMPRSVRDIDHEIAKIREYQRVRRKLVMDYLENAAVAVRPASSRPGWSEVQLSGTAALRVESAGGVAKVEGVFTDQPGLLYPALSEATRQFTLAPGDIEYMSLDHVDPAPVTYRVEGSVDALRFRNALTGTAVKPGAWIEGGEVPTRTLSPDEFPGAPRGATTLGPGTVHVAGTRVFESGESLTILPGTRVVLAPGASIVARGPTRVVGTAARPIEFVGENHLPWGSLAIAGPHTTGTRIRHLRMAGGGASTHRGQLFKGMLSVYGCPEVVLEDCRFGANLTGDDATNIAESQARVERCVWEGARADALDLDAVQGLVRDCRFVAAGNDGLDLMSCEVTVEDCRFLGCGDKGISVGEATQAVVVDCEFRGCVMGTQIKDASRALYARCRWFDNQTAVHLYQKKWSYDRIARAAVLDSTMETSRHTDVHLGPDTDVWWRADHRPSALGKAERLHFVRELPEEWNDLEARVARE